MMRKIALVTNTHQQCGNAAYGRALAHELGKYYDVAVVEDTRIVYETGAELAVINWHPARVMVDRSRLLDLATSRGGVSTILVYQNSVPGTPAMNSCEYWSGATATVSHQEIDADGPIRFIPHGITEVDDLPEMSDDVSIGTAGFAFPWKGFDEVVELAAALGVQARIVSPPYPGHSFAAAHERWRSILGDDLILHDQFLGEAEVARILALNAFNVFPFKSLSSDDALGQSGAARLGVSAVRPLILSDHPKLSSLRKFEGSYYGYGRGEGTLQEVARDLLLELNSHAPARFPGEILRQTGWSVTGRMYRDLIEEILS